MGGSGGSRVGGSAPPQAQPVNYGQLMSSAANAAKSMVREQYRAQIENYPALETLALGTVDRIGGRLGATPQPTFEMVEKRDKNGKVIGYERKQTGMSEGNQQTGDALAAIRRSMDVFKPEDNAPTSIEQSLYDSAASDLALGRSLSPEDVRAAQQSARAAYSARGLGTSLGSSAAEILNRQAYGDQRLAERRNFAAAANNLLTQGVGQRRAAYANAQIAGAGNLINADPYQRALGQGLNYAGGTQAAQMQQIGNTYGNAMSLAGDVAAYNGSMLDSRYNSWANMQGANAAANATRQAGMYGMLGGIGSGLLGGGLMALSDKREKENIKPLGKAGSVLGLTAYKFDYKDGSKGNVGFLAQDVKKVLPEAVEEVNYHGKKRLAIKPSVIGAALAEELMTAKAA
jgi:Chaperone of endosialidase